MFLGMMRMGLLQDVLGNKMGLGMRIKNGLKSRILDFEDFSLIPMGMGKDCLRAFLGMNFDRKICIKIEKI